MMGTTTSLATLDQPKPAPPTEAATAPPTIVVRAPAMPFLDDYGRSIPDATPRVAGDTPEAQQAAYDKIPFGADYLDPQGRKKTKNYRITAGDTAGQQAQYGKVPEGAVYYNPQGQKKRKAYSAPLGLMTQSLLDMATDDATKLDILRRMYGPEAVKSDGEGFYVDLPDGRRARPGATGGTLMGGVTKGAAEVFGDALPMLGAGGGAALTAPGLLTSAAGGGLGFMAGKEANQALLRLAGFGTPRTAGTMAGDVAKEAGEGAMFTVGGRVAGHVIGEAVAAAKTGYDRGVKPIISNVLKYVLGTPPERAGEFVDLATRGYRIPPQMWAPQSPIANLLMRSAQTYGIDPVTPAVEDIGSKDLGTMLRRLGVSDDEIGKALEGKGTMGRTAAIDYGPAGEAAHKRYHELLAESDKNVGASFEALEKTVRAGGEVSEAYRQQAIEAATKALDDNRAIANRIIDLQFQDIEKQIGHMRDLQPGGLPGDLVRAVAGRISATRAAFSEYYARHYQNLERIIGRYPIDVAPIGDATREFLRQLPEDIQRNHPALFRSLADVAETGKLNFIQAHHLRTMLRDLADWDSLPPSFRNGQYKYFSRVINDAIHSPNNPRIVKRGVEILDAIDKDYGEQMQRFKNPAYKTIVKWTEANAPPDATTFVKRLFAGAGRETRNDLQWMLEPQAWDAIVGADMQAALDASRTVVPGKYDGGKFAEQFMHRDRAGIIGDYPPNVQNMLRRQAAYIQSIAKGSTIDVNILPNDEFGVAMRKAHDAAAEIERRVKDNPIKAMKDELSKIAEQHKQAVTAAEAGRRTTPLNAVLGGDSAQLSRAAERIARDSDLTKSAAQTFGKDSPEFKRIRDAWLLDTLTTGEVAASGGIYGKVTALTPEQQELYFGANREDVLTLARALRDLLGVKYDFGAGLYGTSTATHPGTIPVPGAKALGQLPGMIGRIIGSQYLTMAADWLTRPGLVKFVASGLRGDPEQQRMALDIIRFYTRRGGVAGAVLGAAGTRGEGDITPPAGPPPQDWRAQLQGP